MLYIPRMAILGDHSVKKLTSEKFNFEPSKLKNCISRLRAAPNTNVSHYWGKLLLRVAGTGFDQPQARL